MVAHVWFAGAGVRGAGTRTRMRAAGPREPRRAAVAISAAGGADVNVQQEAVSASVMSGRQAPVEV